jgi:coenzyme F420 hydrogenase subunit beta
MRICGPQELFNDVQQRGLCIGCGGCVELCPYFRTYKGRTAMLFPCDRREGRCHAHCPKTEVDLDHLARQQGAAAYTDAPLGPYRRIVTARAGELLMGEGFQSGGTVSALMTCALATGLIEAAVLTGREGMEPVSVLATRQDEILGCALSKYTAAPTLAALNRAVTEGRHKLGVAGTPCQVTAVAQMRANPLKRKDYEDPVNLVVGLFCTWALDTRRLMDLLSRSMDIDTIVKMDIPPPPAEVLVVESTGGRVEIPLSQIRPLVPDGCRICPDMTAEWADLSVGVLEGEPHWNTLIVRTETGEALVQHAVDDGWLVTGDYDPCHLEHLTWAAQGKKRRALAKAEAEGLLNTDPHKGAAALRLDRQTVNTILGRREV